VSSPAMSVGHSYNLMDVRRRRIVNVETASGNRFSVREAAAAPFFHANMYRHLQVNQVINQADRKVATFSSSMINRLLVRASLIYRKKKHSNFEGSHFYRRISYKFLQDK
jgi:hypothetical protein